MKTRLVRRLLTKPHGLRGDSEEVPEGRGFLRSAHADHHARRRATASSAARAPACSSRRTSSAIGGVLGRYSARIRIPKTWYITSDGLMTSSSTTSLEDVYNRKYLEIDQVRREYPHIVQVFKNSRFSPEIVKGLSLALDDFGDQPLIVRSSSLLEDRMGAAFSGKYKSLFLANQGTKSERLSALTDAIAEVYASIFGPDPIEYRAERGLLDLHEEMGIMIQEVVGHAGRPVLPAGVRRACLQQQRVPLVAAHQARGRPACASCRASGTRAVDRVGDDYPVLIAPGQPGLRVNVTPDEVVRYSPAEDRRHQPRDRTLRDVEVDRPAARVRRELSRRSTSIVSVYDGRDASAGPSALDCGPRPRTHLVVTFDGLVSQHARSWRRCGRCCRLLREKLGIPVDIEFASDGKDLYLLQCRPAELLGRRSAVADPAGHPGGPHRLLGQPLRLERPRPRHHAHRLRRPGARTTSSPTWPSCATSGRAVGRLNKLLPKRQFILMGPGRWGSRGDIKLGVSVTYSDINNTAVLIEIAAQEGQLRRPTCRSARTSSRTWSSRRSATCRSTPTIPAALFNEQFLQARRTSWPTCCPSSPHLADVVRVIDVPRATGRPGPAGPDERRPRRGGGHAGIGK